MLTHKQLKKVLVLGAVAALAGLWIFPHSPLSLRADNDYSKVATASAQKGITKAVKVSNKQRNSTEQWPSEAKTTLPQSPSDEVSLLSDTDEGASDPNDQSTSETGWDVIAGGSIDSMELEDLDHPRNEESKAPEGWELAAQHAYIEEFDLPDGATVAASTEGWEALPSGGEALDEFGDDAAGEEKDDDGGRETNKSESGWERISKENL